jgi:hypothetical protein
MAARAIAVLKMSRKVKSLIMFAQAIATHLANDTSTFPSPTPTLAAFQADITALVTAETAVLARGKGAAGARNANRTLPTASPSSRARACPSGR